MKRIPLPATIIRLIMLLLVCSACAKPLPPDSPTPAPATAAPARSASATQTATAEPPISFIWVANPVDQTVLRIDTSSNTITARIPIEGRPETVVYGEGAAWVLDKQHNLVFRIDPATNQVPAWVPLPPGTAETITVGAGFVWVGMTGQVDLVRQVPGGEGDVEAPGMVVQIDARTNQITGQFPVQPVSRLVLNQTALWVLSRGTIDTPIQVFDLATRQGMAVPLQNGPTWLLSDALAVDDHDLWLFSAAYGKIYRASPDGHIFSAIDLKESKPTGYADLLFNASGLWAMTPWGSVLRINPVTNVIEAQIDLHAPLSRLIASPDAIWALSQQMAALFRIDPQSNQIVAQLQTGNSVQPTIVPTATPRVVLWQPCPDAPTSRLKIGDLAYVTKNPPLPNRVRKEPNRDAEIIGLINPAGSMEILEGPACANGWVWWKVKNADLNGWTAEGDKETYWLIPLYK